VIAQTDSLGITSGDPLHTTRMEYDAAGRAIAVIDELGRRTDTVYDNLGRKIRTLGPDAGQGRPTTHYGYDAAGNLRFTTDPRGASAGDAGFTTWIFYDALGRSVATVDALGPDWPIAAVPDALPTTVTTNVVRTAYDARGRVASTTDALGRTTDFSFDNLGRRIASMAPAPAVGVARSVTRFSYDAVGNLTAVTDPLGFVTTYAYDQLDRRTTVTDARGFSTLTSYDVVGNTTSVTDASGNVTRYAYDRRNRLVSETDPLGKATSYAYDLVGNKIRETDRLGRVTSFVYDAADRLVAERWQSSATAAVSHTIKRFYDAADQLLGVTETDTANAAATTAWQFSYDAGGNVVKSRMAPGELVQQPISWSGSLAAGDATIDWDGDGRLERADSISSISVLPGDVIDVVITATGCTPALLLFQGSKPGTFVWYEATSGQLVASRVADAADTWNFAVSARDENAAGNYDIQIIKNGNAIVPTALVEYDLAYDKAGNLLTTTEDQSAVGDMYGFGPAVSGLGIRTSSTLDALRRVTRYEQGIPGGTVTKRADYAYRPDGSVGSVTRFAGAGVSPIGTSTAAYDGLGRLTGIVHAPSAGASIAYGYAYDAASRMTSMTTPEGTSSMTLDAADQLLSASLTGETYAYDKTGNRTSGGTQTGAGNRLAFDGTYRYAYDAEGNRTAKFVDKDNSQTLSVGDTDVTAYGYDQRDRLIAVSHVNAWTSTQAAAVGAFSITGLPGSDLELRYTYDYADRRIRRSSDADGVAGSGAESVSFAAYAGDVRTLEIARPNDKLVIDGMGKVFGFLGQVVQRNFYGNGADEILAVDTIASNAGTRTTSTFWTFTDHQDSVRDIVSGNAADRGKVVEHRQYDSFGKTVRQTTGPQAGAPATAGVGVEFGYAGRPLESRTGLSDNRARWYEPGTGKFISEDPSGFKGGDANLFRYVGNDPLDRIDPSGLMAKWAQPASRAIVPATGWAALGQGLLASGPVGPTVSAMPYAGLISPSPTATRGASSILDSIPPTVVPKPTVPYGRVSGWLASNADASAKMGGVLGAVGHMANGTAAAFTSLFDVVAPRAALDIYAAAFCGAGLPSNGKDSSVRTREAAAFASYVYDRRFDDNGTDAGGLLKTLSIPYAPRDGFQAALFKGQSGTFYYTVRGTEGWQDWVTNIANQFYGRSPAHEYSNRLLEVTSEKISSLGGKVVAAGHSMGAGIGIAGSHATGVDAEVFNPAYVSPIYTSGQPGSIRINVTQGEPLDFMRRILGAPPQGEMHYYAPRPSQGSKHSTAHFPSIR
jgi:RHS repeat-associated protein